MKLYTKSGDDGSTGLFGAGRVGKDHPRIEAYGTVDELNAAIGLAAAANDLEDAPGKLMTDIFRGLQSRLFDIGADLATPGDSEHASKIDRVESTHIEEVEGWIDSIEAGNDEMRSFVLPGGTELAARLHVARTICRRAERRLVALARETDVNRNATVYLNRASDLLFAMARRANKEAGVPDVPWTPGSSE